MKKLLLLIFITSLIFYGCDYFKLQSYKEWQKTSGIETDVDVFIGGFYFDGTNYSPCYWKNGNSTVLPYSTQGQALCVVVRAKR